MYTVHATVCGCWLVRVCPCSAVVLCCWSPGALSTPQPSLQPPASKLQAPSLPSPTSDITLPLLSRVRIRSGLELYCTELESDHSCTIQRYSDHALSLDPCRPGSQLQLQHNSSNSRRDLMENIDMVPKDR